MSVKPLVGLDMDDRDPKNLNGNLQFKWEDVIGEPEEFKSPECTWKCSNSCFNGTKHYCYVLLTVIFAPFLACCSAMNFACLAFQHIWFMGPFLMTWKISHALIRSFLSVTLSATLAPFAEICGLFFAKIKVRYQRLPDGDGDERGILTV